jgi:hypothetical protein
MRFESGFWGAHSQRGVTVFPATKIFWSECLAKITEKHACVKQGEFFCIFPKVERYYCLLWDVGRKRLSIALCNGDCLRLAIFFI